MLANMRRGIDNLCVCARELGCACTCVLWCVLLANEPAAGATFRWSSEYERCCGVLR